MSILLDLGNKNNDKRLQVWHLYITSIPSFLDLFLPTLIVEILLNNIVLSSI